MNDLVQLFMTGAVLGYGWTTVEVCRFFHEELTGANMKNGREFGEATYKSQTKRLLKRLSYRNIIGVPLLVALAVVVSYWAIETYLTVV